MTNDAHVQARAYAQARLDDRLAPEHQAWLAAHLAGCAECRRYAAELNALERLLPETFQAHWDRLPVPARPAHSAHLPIGGPPMTARQKLFNYAGTALGFSALAVLLIGFALALQIATTDSRVPAQALSDTPNLPPTGLPAIFTPPSVMFATTIQFGNSIALEGYNLNPGDGVVTVELLWHALATPPADYMVGVFAMPDGAQSAIFGQHDSVPAAGTRPTGGWQPGEYILDAHDLSITTEVDMAQLVLWVNVYDPQTGERLPSDPAGGGPFNAVSIGALFVPASPPLTPTPLPFPTGGTPAPCPAEGSLCTPTSTPAMETTNYVVTVREGDTLLSIASFYGLTVEALMAANDLTDPASLFVGQELILPRNAPHPTCPDGAPCTPTPTPCADGCPVDPGVDATAALAATLGWTATPIGFVPSVTPCQAGCDSRSATGTAAALIGATGTPPPP